MANEERYRACIDLFYEHPEIMKHGSSRAPQHMRQYNKQWKKIEDHVASLGLPINNLRKGFRDWRIRSLNKCREQDKRTGFKKVVITEAEDYLWQLEKENEGVIGIDEADAGAEEIVSPSSRYPKRDRKAPDHFIPTSRADSQTPNSFNEELEDLVPQSDDSIESVDDQADHNKLPKPTTFRGRRNTKTKNDKKETDEVIMIDDDASISTEDSDPLGERLYMLADTPENTEAEAADGGSDDHSSANSEENDDHSSESGIDNHVSLGDAPLSERAKVIAAEAKSVNDEFKKTAKQLNKESKIRTANSKTESEQRQAILAAKLEEAEAKAEMAKLELEAFRRQQNPEN